MRLGCDGAGRNLGCGGAVQGSEVIWGESCPQTAQIRNSGQALHLIIYLVHASFSLRAQLKASLVPRLRLPVSAICSETSCRR